MRYLIFFLIAVWSCVVCPQKANAYSNPMDTPGYQQQSFVIEEKKENKRPDSSENTQSHSGEYRLGAGDILMISVWKDEALTRQTIVLPDGSITFPLVGRLEARGLTLIELRQTLVERLQKFMPEPELSIEVQRVNSLIVYVLGKVSRPGRFELQDRIDVLQALALAGGLTPFAKTSRIRIFRKYGEKTECFVFDYDEVASGEHLEQNFLLERGDVIVVP